LRGASSTAGNSSLRTATLSITLALHPRRPAHPRRVSGLSRGGRSSGRSTTHRLRPACVVSPPRAAGAREGALTLRTCGFGAFAFFATTASGLDRTCSGSLATSAALPPGSDTDLTVLNPSLFYGRYSAGPPATPARCR
jgi:hypothetical protein